MYSSVAVLLTLFAPLAASLIKNVTVVFNQCIMNEDELTAKDPSSARLRLHVGRRNNT